MRIPIPEECTQRNNGAEIVCAERGRKIRFLNPNKREVMRYLIDDCTLLRASLGSPACKLCDYIVLAWRSEEHYIELKGANVERAFGQLASTIPLFRMAGPDERIYCWIITTESPATSSKFTVLKTKFEKAFNARLTIRTNQYEHPLE